MARKRKEEEAIYSCINACTIPITVGGKVVHKLFKSAGEVEMSEVKMAEGGLGNSDCMLSVPKGTIVPHHFTPENDTAYDDREDQITNPVDYINDDCDLKLIAELMVDENWFSDETATKDGKLVVVKTDVQVACNSIKEQLGEDASLLLEDGESMGRVKALNALMALGKDEAETRKKLFAILKEGKIKIFKGAQTKALAERILEEELYELED